MSDVFWQTDQTPCVSCPFRTDVDLMYWVKEHYEMLLNSEYAIPGILFGCHKYRERPPEERVVCAGWLIDQRERGVPSIALRLALIKDPTVAAALESARLDDGAKLHASLVEMCEANLEAFEHFGDGQRISFDDWNQQQQEQEQDGDDDEGDDNDA